MSLRPEPVLWCRPDIEACSLSGIVRPFVAFIVRKKRAPMQTGAGFTRRLKTSGDGKTVSRQAEIAVRRAFVLRT
jgi:hypothetical protein